MNKILDPRAKVLLILIAAIYVTIGLLPFFESLLIIVYIFPVIFAGLFRIGLMFLIVYVFQLMGSYYLLPAVESPFLIYIISFLFNGFRLLLPGIIAGTYAAKTTTVSEWIAAFKKWHLPNWLLIPIAVMLRFFPAVKEDYFNIRKAMAFRGIGTDLLDLIKSPIQTLEYILIPLLMNATQVAEDLTVSALTKGISLPGRHTSIISLKWSMWDWLFIGMSLLPLILYIGGAFNWST